MKDQIKNAMKEAMKAKDSLRLQTIRGILAAIQYEEMQKGLDELGSEPIIAILKNEIKKRKESIEFAEKAKRPDSKADLLKEIEAIKTFLPSQLSEQVLEKIILDFKINEEKASRAKVNMGSVMKMLKDNYNGQYDGKLASELVQRALR